MIVIDELEADAYDAAANVKSCDSPTPIAMLGGEMVSNGGRLEKEMFTLELNPLEPLTLMVIVSELPAPTSKEELETETAKSEAGGGLPPPETGLPPPHAVTNASPAIGNNINRNLKRQRGEAAEEFRLGSNRTSKRASEPIQCAGKAGPMIDQKGVKR